MAVPTQQNISDALAKNGTNLCAWAKANNHKYRTVWNTVSRWAGRDDRTPHGGLARQIMSDLAVYVEAAQVGSSEEPTANSNCQLNQSVGSL